MERTNKLDIRSVSRSKVPDIRPNLYHIEWIRSIVEHHKNEIEKAPITQVSDLKIFQIRKGLVHAAIYQTMTFSLILFPPKKGESMPKYL